MSNESQNNLGITEAENSGTGVETSKARKGGATSNVASRADLELALQESQKANAILLDRLNKLENTSAKDSGSDAIERMAAAITAALNNKKEPTVREIDDINRSTQYTEKATVDGRSLMEAQQAQQMFRDEPKEPISIPKSMSNYFGPSLAVSVNGVRVSIPCDGKVYYINKTHCEHAKERIAKVDAMNYSPSDNIIEVEN